ncbi:phage major capsid protein [Leuconostoc gasicomitatum]|uniref:phage major capsid protein n=1 Tax=Leuconostoc gasicomitatum TaxID=115778 RepID=UPI001CC7B186|nr:phage major capsid protein [Leuconostoc gasicomitatum]MBZ5951054.1 phage major capsid protein [Leuconostoc gasicomitatum]
MTIQEELAQKQTELRSKIVEARKAVADKSDNADSLMTEVRDYESDIKKLKELVDAMPDTLDEEDKGDDKGNRKPDDSQPTPPANPADDQQRSHEKEKEVRDVPQPVGATPKKEYRDLMNEFLHSKGEKRAGITSTDVGAIIPEDIIYNPEAAIDTVTDLGNLVTKTPVKTASGKYPILKKASGAMPTVAELEKNPEMATPDFNNVAWEVATYREAIPVSQESIEDAQVDLVAIVSQWVQQRKTATTNAKIAAALSAFKAKSAKSATLVDDLKTIKNTAFDPAYNLSWVVTASAYNALDLLKDTTGRPLLQEEIGSATGTTLFGKPLTVVEDTAFGGIEGVKQLFIGDLKRAILFANRADAAVRWVDDNVHGQFLQGVLRFGISAADSDAGVFVTITDTPSAG